MLFHVQRFPGEPMAWFATKAEPGEGMVTWGPLPQPANLTEARKILRAFFAAPEYELEMVFSRAGRPRVEKKKTDIQISMRLSGPTLDAIRGRGMRHHKEIADWIASLIKQDLGI